MHRIASSSAVKARYFDLKSGSQWSRLCRSAKSGDPTLLFLKSCFSSSIICIRPLLQVVYRAAFIYSRES